MSMLDGKTLTLLESAVVWPAHIPDNHFCRFYSTSDIRCSFHPILSTTPKGLWVEGHNGKAKYIGNAWKKKFAHATPEEAFNSFKWRKRKQIEILQGQLEEAKEDLALAEAFTLPQEV